MISILGVGLFVGLAALRNALFKYYLARQDMSFVVYDSSDPPRWLGTAVGFDAQQAPLLPFVDYGVKYPTDAAARDLRALIAVRYDSFSSHQPLFYAESNCTGTPCIAHETSSGSGPISALHAMQVGPAYAVGAGLGRKLHQGALYRSLDKECPAEMSSKWVSQAELAGQRCVTLTPAVPRSVFKEAQAVETSSGTATVNVLQLPTAPFYLNAVNNPLQTMPRAPGAEGG